MENIIDKNRLKNPTAKLIRKLIKWYNETEEEVWSDDDPDDIAIDSFYIQILFRIRQDKRNIIDGRKKRLEAIIRHQKIEDFAKNNGGWQPVIWYCI
jgi:hypothetical protein